jgi:hypothetical protein
LEASMPSGGLGAIMRANADNRAPVPPRPTRARAGVGGSRAPSSRASEARPGGRRCAACGPDHACGVSGMALRWCPFFADFSHSPAAMSCRRPAAQSCSQIKKLRERIAELLLVDGAAVSNVDVKNCREANSV